MRRTATLLITTVIIIIGLQHGLPAYASAFGDTAKQTFGAGGIGNIIPQLMLIAVAGYLFSMLCSAVGQGQIAGMVKLVTLMTCVAAVASTAYKAINAVFQVFS